MPKVLTREKKGQAGRKRQFVFTDYVCDRSFWETFDCKYVMYGEETCPTTGRKHFQGWVCFAAGKTLKAVIDLLRPRHVEVKFGTVANNVKYCSKEGAVYERGTRPMEAGEKGEAEKQRWVRALAHAKEGNFEAIDADIQIRQIRNLEYIYDRAVRERQLEDTTETHEWYYGPTGTGKSRKARTENADAYLKMCNKWWDGYVNQDVVLIEDFDKKHDVLIHHLKIWADRYPFPAEAKGRSLVIRPKKIIVTSNYHPGDIWTEEADLGPIMRRFKVIAFQ